MEIYIEAIETIEKLIPQLEEWKDEAITLSEIDRVNKNILELISVANRMKQSLNIKR